MGKPLRKRKRPTAAPAGGGYLLLNVLTSPVLAGPRLVHWIAGKIVEEVERQEFDEAKLQGQLLDIQIRHELGEIDDEECAREERRLLNRLNYIRNTKQGD